MDVQGVCDLLFMWHFCDLLHVTCKGTAHANKINNK